MPAVSDILATKGTRVHRIAATATVLAATQKMNQHRIGALIVMQQGRLAGIFTERDVLSRVVAQQRDPTTTLVGEVMSCQVACCPPEMELEEVSQIMRDRRIRHLPVCDSCGNLLGIISIGDLNAFNASNQQATIHYLSEYIYGRA